MAKLQSDPVERRFSQYRQLNGGNFLVSLKEVKDSEKILLCQTLIKENVDFFSDDSLLLVKDSIQLENLINDLEKINSEIHEASLFRESEDVVLVVAGYVAKKLKEKTTYSGCIMKLCGSEIECDSYFAHLSRGGMTVPSASLAQFVSTSFAVLDTTDSLLQKHAAASIREAAHHVLKTYCCNVNFTCDRHVDWGSVSVRKIVINIFYNNKRKLQSDEVRKDDLVSFKKRQRKKD